MEDSLQDGRKMGRSARLLLGVLALNAACSTPLNTERDRAKRMTPPKIGGEASRSPAPDEAAAAGATGTYQIRIYVDRDYRRESANWQKEAKDLVEAASAITEGLFGAKLHIESIRHWETSNSKDTLSPALDSLARLDPGREVHWVVGLLGSSPLLNASQDQLGMAYVFARHFVVRGLRGAEDITEIENSFKNLSKEERDELIRNRRRHRQASVFLHEWAHTIGAPHARSPEFINAAFYDTRQERFDEYTTRLIAIGLHHWRREQLADSEVHAWGSELQPLLSSVPSGIWEAKSAEQLMSYVEEMEKSAVTPTGGTQLSREDAFHLIRADEALRKGRHADARAELASLVPRYPNDAHVQVLACQVEVAIKPLAPEATKQCERAAALVAPDDLESQINLAEVYLARKEIANAVKTLANVRQRMTAEADAEAATKPGATAAEPKPDSPPAKAPPPAWATVPKENPRKANQPAAAKAVEPKRPMNLAAQPRAWAYLANLYQRAGCLAWAEEAAKRAQDPKAEEAIHKWVTRTRRWLGLGAAGQVPPEKEGELVAQLEQLQERMFQEPQKSLRPAVEALRESFPDAPAPYAAQCALGYRSGNLAEAKKSCERALALDDEAIQAHYLLGLTYLAVRQSKSASTHLERAIQLDPECEGCWRALMNAYRSSNNKRELSALKARYEQQFSKSAP